MKEIQQSPMGRPIKNVIEPIKASPEDIAKAIFKDADNRLEKNNNKERDCLL